MRLPGATTACILLLGLSPSIEARKPAKDATLLTNIKSLTLRAGQTTSHRRVSALPQLQCVGGDGCRFYGIDVLRCKNAGAGYDEDDVAWTCQAALPPEFKLGSTDVVCEGYDSPEDPYVLKGSCAVEYRLLLTPAGEAKFHDQLQGGWLRSSESGSHPIFVLLFWLAFFGIFGFVIWSIFFSPDARAARGRAQRGFFGGGGGGGGDDGHDDPPPPYTPYAPRPKYSHSQRPYYSSGGIGAWRPGFWSGAATGATAGYAAGRWGANNNRAQAPHAGQAGPSNWFGGGSGGSRPARSQPSVSSTRYESTGFGETRRR